MNHSLRPRHPASDEGLAAGTGLLTGPAARERAPEDRPCPHCRGAAQVETIDLVRFQVNWHCHLCGHDWVEHRVPERRRRPQRAGPPT